MTYQYVIYDKEQGLARIRLNRPEKLNALNPGVYEELERIFGDCKSDPGIKVVIISGNEKAFAAGADIDTMVEADVNAAYELTDQSRKVHALLSDMPKPTIAAIAGYTLGGGLELALCCDFRISAANARLGLPEINLGIIPGGGGTQRLSRLIGTARATELILLGKPLTAEKAQEIGLVNRCVPIEKLASECEQLAQQLLVKSAIAIRSAKAAIRSGMDMSLQEGLQLEQTNFCILFGTPVPKEGMTAFLQKREPDFKDM
jgi:enoyl-CoA hydratase/carnithine racemase